MSLRRVNVFTVFPGGIIPRPDAPNTANLQYDFDTNQLFAIAKGLTKPVTQPQSIASAAFSQIASGSTIAIDASNGAITNSSIISSAVAVTFDLSSLQNGSQINIQYAKATTSSCVLTFPSTSLIRSQDGQEEPLLTTTITGSDQSIFLISALKTSDHYLVAVSRFKI